MVCKSNLRSKGSAKEASSKFNKKKLSNKGGANEVMRNVLTMNIRYVTHWNVIHVLCIGTSYRSL